MREELNLKDFDILGVISLNDVDGIEKYVTPVKENGITKTYLSRSKEYYNVKNMSELASEREQLKTKLTRELSKRNFVILENMANCSGKAYFKKFEQYILSGKNPMYLEQLNRAEKCLTEDIRNIMIILQKEGLIQVNPMNILPYGDENSEKRAIEMDNKAMLYLFAKSLKMKKDPSEVEVLTPGYGSVYIGPIFKAMYGFDFTNTLKSKYIESTIQPEAEVALADLMSSERAFDKNKTVLVLDDNIGTGSTMLELQNDLKKAGVNQIISGAVQYNWRNYHRVSTGDKKDIERFEVNDFDIISPFNYAGHKLYKHAIAMLHSSGTEYIEYLKSKSYRKENYCDLEGAIVRSLYCANQTGLKLADETSLNKKESVEDIEREILDRYKNGDTELKNPISQRVMKIIINNVERLNDLQEHDVGLNIEEDR